MEPKEKVKKKDGVYLSNFVATAISFFVLVLAVATGFFAKAYFSERPTNAGTVPVAGTQPAPVKTKTPKEIFDLMPKVTDADHIKGDKNAKIMLVEYSDFQCPYCARFHPTVSQFLASYPDVAYVFRHLPLDFHQFALERAKASECAVKLGGPDTFWSYADVVFGSSDLNNVTLTQVATQLGLNSASFDECIKSTEFDKKISDLSDGGKKFLSAISESGGYGTPGAAIINRDKKIGVRLGGAVPLSELESAYTKVK